MPDPLTSHGLTRQNEKRKRNGKRKEKKSGGSHVWSGKWMASQNRGCEENLKGYAKWSNGVGFLHKTSNFLE
jgi:hypothetical protein